MKPILISFCCACALSARAQNASTAMRMGSSLGKSLAQRIAYGFFGVLYSTSLWNGSQSVSKPTNPFSLAGFWRVVKKRALPSGTLGGGCLGFCSLMRHLLDWSQTRRVDIHRRRDRPAYPGLFIGRVAHGQYFEREHDLSPAERIVAIDGQLFVVQVRDEKAAGLALVVLHQDRGADLAILLGHVFDVVGKNQRLVARAEDLVAVDHHFDGVAGALAGQRHVDRRSEDFIVSVDIAERELDPGNDV